MAHQCGGGAMEQLADALLAGERIVFVTGSGLGACSGVPPFNGEVRSSAARA